MRFILVLSALALSLSLPSLGLAQSPISLETVLEPLVVAAEADVQHDSLPLALARATFVVSALPHESALSARAAGLSLLVQQRLAGGLMLSVTPSVMLAPLVDAAELDGASGRVELAHARLDLVLAQLASTDPLAVRATGLRAAIVTPTMVPAPMQAPPTVTYVTPSSPYTVPSGAPVAESTPRRRSGTNWALAGPGIGLLAGGWVIGWVTTLVWNLASASCTRGVLGLPTACSVAGPYGDAILQMLVPLLGPWWTIGSNTYRGNDIWFPTLIGVMQPVGLILLIVGLVSPRDDPEPQAGTVRVTPTANGLAIEGWF